MTNKYINILDNRICQIVDRTTNPNYVVVYYIGSGKWNNKGCISIPEHEVVLVDNLIKL